MMSRKPTALSKVVDAACSDTRGFDPGNPLHCDVTPALERLNNRFRAQTEITARTAPPHGLHRERAAPAKSVGASRLNGCCQRPTEDDQCRQDQCRPVRMCGTSATENGRE